MVSPSRSLSSRAVAPTAVLLRALLLLRR